MWVNKGLIVINWENHQIIPNDLVCGCKFILKALLFVNLNQIIYIYMYTVTVGLIGPWAI
jgi:hypothetical protein